MFWCSRFREFPGSIVVDTQRPEPDDASPSGKAPSDQACTAAGDRGSISKIVSVACEVIHR